MIWGALRRCDIWSHLWVRAKFVCITWDCNAARYNCMISIQRVLAVSYGYHAESDIIRFLTPSPTVASRTFESLTSHFALIICSGILLFLWKNNKSRVSCSVESQPVHFFWSWLFPRLRTRAQKSECDLVRACLHEFIPRILMTSHIEMMTQRFKKKRKKGT